ncbi:TonB-dependent receptor [bacterium]|nr:TonB-dependent receptor [bacterium]
MKRFWLRMGFGMSLVTILSGIGFAGQQGTVARGASSTGVIELEEVVVTATKIEQNISDLPVSASVITRDEMEKKRVTFVDEALKYEPGVVQKRTKFADTRSMATLRGFSGGQRTLVLLDGIPTNDAYTGGTYLCDLPVGTVERIEVVNGPFSSLYGGEAMGGVINVITKTPKKEGFEVKSSASAYDTYRHILSYGNKLGKFSFSLNLEKKTSKGDRTDLVTKSVKPGTSTTQVTGWTKTTDNKGSPFYLLGDKGKNYWDQNQYGFKLNYCLNPASNLSFSYKGNKREYGYRDPQSNLVDGSGKPVDSGKVELPGEGTMTLSPKDFLGTWGELEDNTYGLCYDTLLVEIALKGRLNFSDSNSFYVSPETGANYSGGPGKLSKTSPKDTIFGEVQFDIPLMETNLITCGLTYRDDSARAKDWKVSNWKDESSIGTGNPTYEVGGKARTIAFYTQGEVQLINALKLFLGARYDTWKNYDASLIDGTKSTIYEDKEKQAFSPKVGLLYKPKFEKGLYKLEGIRASWGKAFRPPTIHELYRTWKYGSKTYVGNPELSCETTQSWEIGIDQHLSKIAISATYFQSKIDDLIYNKWVTETYSIRENAGRGQIAGFEMEGKMKLAAGLDAFANYTLQDTEITSNPAEPKTVGKDFEYVPEKMYNIGVSFHRNDLDASCTWHWVKKMYATSDNTDVAEGVYGAHDTVDTVDMKIGYAFKERMRVSLACDNLLDKEYYQYYKSPGRTVTFEVGYKY